MWSIELTFFLYIVESGNVSEELCPNDLNEETIEALIADSNLVLMFLLILSNTSQDVSHWTSTIPLLDI